MYHMSHFTCLVSHVRCQVSHIICHIFSSSFISQIGGASGLRVCYQWGLPRLLLTHPVYLGLFYKHLCHSVIDSLNRSWFVKISSRHFNTQAIRARDPEFWHNVHHLLFVTWHMSYVMCLMSCVTCHVLHVMCQVSHVSIHHRVKRKMFKSKKHQCSQGMTKEWERIILASQLG